jgi:hypothetical protein
MLDGLNKSIPRHFEYLKLSYIVDEYVYSHAYSW